MNIITRISKGVTSVARNHQRKLERAELRALQEEFDEQEVAEMEAAKKQFLSDLRMAGEQTEPHNHGSDFGLRMAEVLG